MLATRELSFGRRALRGTKFMGCLLRGIGRLVTGTSSGATANQRMLATMELSLGDKHIEGPLIGMPATREWSFGARRIGWSNVIECENNL